MSTKPTGKNLTPKQRIEALKSITREGGKQKKILTGTVSASKTSFEHLVLTEAPAADSACRQRLLDLQAKFKAIEAAKQSRKSYKDKLEEAEYQLLFEEVREGEQIELPNVDCVLSQQSLQLIHDAVVGTRQVDASRDKMDEDERAKLPPPSDPKVMGDLEAQLDAWMGDLKIAADALASEKQAEHPDEVKGKRPRVVEPAPPMH